MLFVETGHISVSLFRSFRVLVSDNQSNREPQHSYTCIPISTFLLQSSHLLSASPVALQLEEQKRQELAIVLDRLE